MRHCGTSRGSLSCRPLLTATAVLLACRLPAGTPRAAQLCRRQEPLATRSQRSPVLCPPVHTACSTAVFLSGDPAGSRGAQGRVGATDPACCVLPPGGGSLQAQGTWKVDKPRQGPMSHRACCLRAGCQEGVWRGLPAAAGCARDTARGLAGLLLAGVEGELEQLAGSGGVPTGTPRTVGIRLRSSLLVGLSYFLELESC